MTDREKRAAAKAFAAAWKDRGKEDEDARSYWIEILANILGVENPTTRMNFEKKVIGFDGKTKRIDVYIPETQVLIEQKSLGIPLDKPQPGHDGKTPYQQAEEYNTRLAKSEKARWIVLSNFSDIWVYDMEVMPPKPVKLKLAELQDQYHVLDFLVDQQIERIAQEKQLSLDAGELVGKIYDCLLKQYPKPDDSETLKSLNRLCVQIVFCLYAEDADLFGRKNMFHDYMAQFDAPHARKGLRELFKVLSQKPEERDKYLKDDDPLLAGFPYVNGGLFDGDAVDIPPFTEELLDLILAKASEDFDWSGISPTIFGALFESTLNPETRRNGGMHYTSIENIHKVIDPLFLDSLKTELADIKAESIEKAREKKLKAYQEKLASLIFLDPAAGSGNFLTETYLSLRKLENEALRIILGGQRLLSNDNPIRVSISQFYGIEVNDFAVTVAKTALWIAESQMMKATADIVQVDLDFLPLKTNANIVEGNALKLDWNNVVQRSNLSYIIGNPPFVGARFMDKNQKADLNSVFPGWKNAGNLDYVACWYKKATEMMKGTYIRAALVSTNSICQGESVANLWKPLFADGVHFDFAYRTFQWDSEASTKAHVHCVVLGFSVATNALPKKIFEGEGFQIVKHINGYLVEAEDVFVESRVKPICDVPEIGIGNKPIDGGFYLFEKEEMEAFISKEPTAEQYFHPWYGSREFINRKPRYCLWLGDCSPAELRRMPECMKRVHAVREYRLASPSEGTIRLADKPTRFHVENMPKGTYVVVPEVSSERRQYIPMGFITPDVLCSNLVKLIPDASLYHFGVLESEVHMDWMRAVAGRLKSDYRYSKDIVYNNFPWPEPTDEQKAKIEQTAQAILDARAIYPDSSLADLYDPDAMKPELRTAHRQNDIAVMAAYGIKKGDAAFNSEPARVAFLMKLYQAKVKENAH